MPIDIHFPTLSNRRDEKVSVYLNGVYWLSKEQERWFISGVHPQGTDSHSGPTPQEGEGWEEHNKVVEDAFPAFLAAIAAKKAELKSFADKIKEIEKIEAIKLARENFDLSLREAKELVEGMPSTRYQATILPASVFPTVDGDQLAAVKGLGGEKNIPVSLLKQVEDLIDWQDELLEEDFQPCLVQLLSTGVCYGETDRLSLKFKIEEETTYLYDWKLRDLNSSWTPDNKTLRVCSLDAAPALYSMYLAGKEDESKSWKQRLGDLINRN